MSEPKAATDPALVPELRALIADGGVREFDPVAMAVFGKPGWTLDELTSALEALAVEGALTRAEYLLCPVASCQLPIAEEDIAADRCPRCTTDFRTLDDSNPVRRAVYLHRGPISRDLQWAVLIHGMNTLGCWQEDFSWRLALKLRYSAPILIYKYGIVRVGALFRFRHRTLVASLGERLSRSFVLAAGTGRTRSPDVILHSFGTLLFTKLLDDARFNDLKFGRVIMAGSIVRPDYPWWKHINAGRVEAVLNHCGSRDWIVDTAAFILPDTGPSGRVGISDPAVLNVRAEGYDHSIFFEDEGLNEGLQINGVWNRFLRVPIPALDNLRMDVAAARAWRPLWLPFRRIALPIFVGLISTVVSLVGWGVFWLVRHISD